jgi:hypothetical protein
LLAEPTIVGSLLLRTDVAVHEDPRAASAFRRWFDEGSVKVRGTKVTSFGFSITRGTGPPVARHTGGMDVALLYFDGCPNWTTTQSLLLDVMDELGVPSDRLVLQRVETPEEAADLSFHGSPTVLVDGVDPFDDPNAAVGLACRLYPTETGLAGSPSRQQLTQVLRSLR